MSTPDAPIPISPHDDSERLESIDKASRPGLKKIPPYWYPYTTMAKGRWLGREILEVVSTEFRDRSMEFYRYALESGVTTVNGQVAKPDTIIKNGDRIENVSHRHEPPVTSTPVRIILHDKERQFIVIDKPGSIPVHAAGRYFRNSLIEILKTDFGFEKTYTVNRLDRLTSGLMILPLNPKLAATLTTEFVNGQVKKEYIARCTGNFPEEEVICEEPLLTVDRQMGLNIVHPEGKHAKTIFKRIRYDVNTNTSVLHCRPQTGRSHQIRVHLQFLGHPIANDPIYSDIRIWGENLGKGGIDVTPSDDRAAPEAPSHIQFSASASPESLAHSSSDPAASSIEEDTSVAQRKLLPRETGHDIGMGSPVPLSAEAVGIITRLRNMKDEAEDWGRWRDVIFRAKAALCPRDVEIPPSPHFTKQRKQKKKQKAGKKTVEESSALAEEQQVEVAATLPQSVDHTLPMPPNQITREEVARLAADDAAATSEKAPEASASNPDASVPLSDPDGMQYCPECFVPLHPDPKPESLYIFLHAVRYTTSLGTFETGMPEWAAEGWEWDRSI